MIVNLQHRPGPVCGVWNLRNFSAYRKVPISRVIFWKMTSARVEHAMMVCRCVLPTVRRDVLQSKDSASRAVRSKMSDFQLHRTHITAINASTSQPQLYNAIQANTVNVCRSTRHLWIFDDPRTLPDSGIPGWFRQSVPCRGNSRASVHRAL